MSGEQAGSTSEAPLLFFRAYSALECGAFIRRRSWDEKMYLFLAHPVLCAEDLEGPDALLPTERAFTIVGRNQVLLNGAWIGAYNNTAGFFPGERGIFVEYRLTPPGNPALVLHELGHFWLHDLARVTQASAADVGAPWFNEGAVSLLPLSLLSFMGESRQLDNTRLKRELRLKLRHPSPATGLLSNQEQTTTG